MKVLAIAGLGTALLGARPADACSPIPCRAGAFVPGNAAHVPANLPGIAWRPMDDNTGNQPDPSNLSLVATDDPTTPIPLVVQQDAGAPYLTLVPSIALTPGKQYTLADATRCPAGPEWETPSVTFTTTANAPYPATLGITTASAAQLGGMDFGIQYDCTVDQTVDSMSDLGLAMATDAMPWQDAFLYSTTVDDHPWIQDSLYGSELDPGSSWFGRGADRVFEICSGGGSGLGHEVGTSEGAHAVAFHATLANTSLALASRPATIELSCAGYAGSGSGSDQVTPTRIRDAGCLSASPTTPGALAIAMVLLLAGRRRRTRP